MESVFVDEGWTDDDEVKGVRCRLQCAATKSMVVNEGWMEGDEGEGGLMQAAMGGDDL